MLYCKSHYFHFRPIFSFVCFPVFLFLNVSLVLIIFFSFPGKLVAINESRISQFSIVTVSVKYLVSFYSYIILLTKLESSED